MSATDFPIDIVLPVYNAVEDVRRCVDSVLRHTTPPFRLVVVDDASPDPAARRFLDGLASQGRPEIELLRNEVNLGFVGAANRGMRRSRADVLLLNSDTIVGSRWLDKLRRCAASDPRIGTVTPFSNNAEICSFPEFCVDNPWREADDLELVNRALEDVAAPFHPDLPTGVGFCMLIRRAVLDRCGSFDEAFGRGYGEENDLCRRAEKSGFRNVLCTDTFVVHTGGRSFQGEKSTLGARNLELLQARHPEYVELVTRYIAEDPVAPLRRLAAARLRALASPLPGVLHLIHAAEHGGTEVQARTLIAAGATRLRGYLAVVRGDRWIVEEHSGDRREGEEPSGDRGKGEEHSGNRGTGEEHREAFSAMARSSGDGERSLGAGAVATIEFDRPRDEPLARFMARLAGTFRVGLLHLHNVSGEREALVEALPRCGVPYGYTAHDLSFACPMITFMAPGVRYCGSEKSADVCNACVRHHPHLAGIEVGRWRAMHHTLLERAAFVIAPSRWAAQTLRDYFGVDAAVVPHAIAPPRRDPPVPLRTAIVLPEDGVPTVAVVGAIGPDKGARRLERLVALTRESGAPLRWVVIGYVDRTRGPLIEPDAVLAIHGAYDRRDLPDLLAHYRTRLVAFPSAGPETFSLTLSEVWSCGYPVVVPPIGALGERVAASGGGWILDDWTDDRRVLEQIQGLLDSARSDDFEVMRRRVTGLSLSSVEAMFDATAACYPSFAGADAADPALPLTCRSLAGFPWPRAPDPPVSAGPSADSMEGAGTGAGIGALVAPSSAGSDGPAGRKIGGAVVEAHPHPSPSPGIVRLALHALARTRFGRALSRRVPERVRGALRARLP